jgi:hypothetical protein
LDLILKATRIQQNTQTAEDSFILFRLAILQIRFSLGNLDISKYFKKGRHTTKERHQNSLRALISCGLSIFSHHIVFKPSSP